MVADSRLTGVAELCQLKQDILSSVYNKFNPGNVSTLLKRLTLVVKHQDKQTKAIVNTFVFRTDNYFWIFAKLRGELSNILPFSYDIGFLFFQTSPKCNKISKIFEAVCRFSLKFWNRRPLFLFLITPVRRRPLTCFVNKMQLSTV